VTAPNTRIVLVRESWPILGSFTISRGAKTQAEVLVALVNRDGVTGRGECVPYARYGESMDGVSEQARSAFSAIEAGISREELQTLLPAGAARNAIDCALWDLEAKLSGVPVARALDIDVPRPVGTAVTISLGDPSAMARRAAELAHMPLIKAKFGAAGDEERMRAVREAAPEARVIADANEGWSTKELPRLLDLAAQLGFALVEQPLPAGEDHALAEIARPVPVCADESAHSAGDVESLRDRYDAVNIKLDKAGGLTGALSMRREARALGLGVMVGCMVATSLAMAPAVLLAQDSDFADVDGPLLLQRDRAHGLAYEAGFASPPSPELWG
jgi:L-alanine-DL-glutamate epimerase-like enolase superfamily enzyme